VRLDLLLILLINPVVCKVQKRWDCNQIALASLPQLLWSIIFHENPLFSILKINK
jgi:hypothetical protein